MKDAWRLDESTVNWTRFERAARAAGARGELRSHLRRRRDSSFGGWKATSSSEDLTTELRREAVPGDRLQ
jgi:hypothetical protein